MRRRRWGEVHALLASSAPPILWSLIEFARHRRVDALSVLVLGGIALSLLAMLGGGGVKFLQLREKLVTVAVGLAFLGSALIGKPLIYELARATHGAPIRGRGAAVRDAAGPCRLSPHDDGYDAGLGPGPACRGRGLGPAGFTLTIRDYLIVHPILGYGAIGALSLWSFLYGRAPKARRGAPGGDGRRLRLRDGSLRPLDPLFAGERETPL